MNFLNRSRIHHFFHKMRMALFFLGCMGCFCLGAVPCPAASGDAARWTPAGFGAAGNFLSVHFDPSRAGVVYAASDVAGVFRSVDYGRTWEHRNSGLGNHEVSSFAVDPFDSNTLYAGAGAFTASEKAGMYISHDSGLTWSHLASTYANGITFRKYRTMDAIAPDPADSGVIISGSRAKGIWRSANGGSSWTQVYAPQKTSVTPFNDGTIDDDPAVSPYPAPISVVRFDPSNASTVYAGLDGIGVAKSANSGASGSWRLVNTGLPSQAAVKSLAVARDGVIYVAAGQSGVYKSADGGSKWQAVNTGLPTLGADHWVSSVAVDPDDSNTAWLTLATYDWANVWKTTNGGNQWVGQANVTYDPVNDPTETWLADPTMTWQATADPHNSNRLFYVGYWDIFRTANGGNQWTAAIEGAQNTCVTALFYDSNPPQGSPPRLFASHMDAGLLYSTDNGKTWAMSVPQTYDTALAGHYWNMAAAQSGATRYYYLTSSPWAQTYTQVLRSTDGVAWTRVFSKTRTGGSFMDGMLGLAVDPGQPSTVYVSQDGGQIYKSIDNGTNWTPAAGQPGGNDFTFGLVVDQSGRIFAATLVNGLWRSSDGGANWTRVLTRQSAIFDLTVDGSAVYACTGDSNLYKSTDGGNNWQNLTNYTASTDGDGVAEQGRTAAVDPGDSSHIVFSRQDTWHPADKSPGLVESFDGGKTWRDINTGLGQTSVTTLAFGPAGVLYAGTWCAGVWRRDPSANPRDFNADGRIDLIYRHSSSGNIGTWYMNGTSETSWILLKDPYGQPANHGTAWDIKGVGDFNGDGRGDAVYRHSSGNIGVWMMNGVNETTWKPFTDKNGGKPANHSPWEIKAIADFNNDSRPDILYRHPATGNIGVWYMNGATETTWALVGNSTGDPANHGMDWDIQGAGDFNNDGHQDILYRHFGGNLGVWLMNGVNETTWRPLTDINGRKPANHGTAWNIRGSGDFNNDGHQDILYRHSAGKVGVWLMNGTAEKTWAYINNHGTWDIR